MPFRVLQTITLLMIISVVSACTSAPRDFPEAENQDTETMVGIVGEVTDSLGNPATGTYIYAYRSMKSNLRGPADFEALVDMDGSYFLDMVEGDYYLVARLRQSGAESGPPKAGDAWALPKNNPVTVESGKLSTVNFMLQGVTQPMLMREGTLTSGDTGFTGILVDSENKPLPGAFVIAYPEPDYQRMPEATSPAAGDDGRFYLYVERPGQWCLAARTRTRGQPIAGEPYGLLGKKQEGCRDSIPGRIIEVGTIKLTPYR